MADTDNNKYPQDRLQAIAGALRGYGIDVQLSHRKGLVEALIARDDEWMRSTRHIVFHRPDHIGFWHLTENCNHFGYVVGDECGIHDENWSPVYRVRPSEPDKRPLLVGKYPKTVGNDTVAMDADDPRWNTPSETPQ